MFLPFFIFRQMFYRKLQICFAGCLLFVKANHLFYAEERHRIEYNKKKNADAVYCRPESDDIVPAKKKRCHLADSDKVDVPLNYSR